MNHTATVARWLLIAGLGCFWISNHAADTQNQIPQGGIERIYKSTEETQLKLYIYGLDGSRAPNLKPGIIFFFGGGWRGGTPRQFENHCQYFASRGMVAITADYRVLSRHKTKAVECVRDAKSAIRWVRKHAAELGVHSEQIVAGGGSAGGHLAACTGVIRALDDPSEDLTISSQPNALVLFNPAVVLAPVTGYPSVDAKKWAALEARTGIASKNISPFHHIQSVSPPTIIFHGQDDKTVSYWTVQAFQSRQLLHGGQSILVPFPGKGHGFFNYGRFDNEPFRRSLKEADAFLESLGFISGGDTVDLFLSPNSSANAESH